VVVAGAQVISQRFVLLSQAGAGGMGTVYRARDLTNNATVAVKLLSLGRPFDLARFGREAALLASVHHPNVVEYIAHGESDGVHYLAQEWITGTTLAAHLRTVGATVQEAVVLARGVAGALAAIHALGVVHRDVKPANVIVVDGDPARIKLVDFGIARHSTQSRVLTRTGIVVGTPAYMAPEQARGESQLDVSTDVFALGCVLYEALTGRIAFAASTATAVRAKVLLSDPPKVSEYCPEIPAELGALVAEMLDKRPDHRPRDGAAVLARLDALGPLPAGPSRRVGVSEPPTKQIGITTTRPQDPVELQSYLLVAMPDDPEPEAARAASLDKIAAEHGMNVHVLDDGVVLLAAQPGQTGVVKAAHAATALAQEIPDGAVALFGRAKTDSFGDAVDRGADLLERTRITTLFAPEEVNLAIDEVVAAALKAK